MHQQHLGDLCFSNCDIAAINYLYFRWISLVKGLICFILYVFD